MKKYEVEEYVTERGKVPFAAWLLNLKDKKPGKPKFWPGFAALRLGTLATGKRSKGPKACMKCGNITALAIVFFTHGLGKN